ncbi:hypothetical protein IEQ34_010325 [Dendrobium chrysotoxum]|uniref:Uncharacterized protein n=1 Tax=Dendrobium chrysotoxum TaxID=161865 RepID=A0AAV7GLK2_DENCH|nr:hypothetical protein IEQ34_010325 [Dendrobium chrysotoxum]
MKSVTTSFPPAQPEGVKPDGRISAAPFVYERKLVKAGLEDLGDASLLPETSPLLGGSRFHPLSAARGEENVRKIARSLPPTFQDEAESSKKRRSPFAGARSVIHLNIEAFFNTYYIGFIEDIKFTLRYYIFITCNLVI